MLHSKKSIEKNKFIANVHCRYTSPTNKPIAEKLVYLENLHPKITDTNHPLFYTEVEYKEIEFIEHGK